MSTKHHDRTGFTLIELLVVIAIIAILAAILFPIFIVARERARQVGCVQNLKQLGIGIRAYCDDNGNCLPMIRLWDHIVTGHPTWDGTYIEGGNGKLDLMRGAVWPYVRNKPVYLCPSDKNRKLYDPGTNTWYYNPRSYSMNGRLAWRNIETMKKIDGTMESTFSVYEVPPRGAGLRLNRLSKLCLLIHENRGGQGESGIDDGEYNWWDNQVNIPDRVHFDGTTVLFCDWHVKWQTRRTIMTAVTNGEYEPNR